jgi:hypothetical protein
MRNEDGDRWFMWASYRFADGEQLAGTAQLVIDSILIPDPDDGDPLAVPQELENEAIFEADG